MDEGVFEKAVEAYSITKPDEIPYIDDITRSVDYPSIENPEAANQLEHHMKLLKTLPELCRN